MSKLHFIVHPSILPAIIPHYVKWLWRTIVASFLVYWLYIALNKVQVLSVSASKLFWALVLLTPLIAIFFVKHRMIKLHNTKYLFYDTHVVEEYRFITKKRHSVPFGMISRVRIKSNIWNRISHTDDIHLQTGSNDDNQDLVLKSVKNAHEVEHRIYKLLHRQSSNSSE